MPITALDPDSALVLVDLQCGILRFPTVHPVEAVVKNAAALAAAFRRAGLPVVLVNVAGSAPGRAEQSQTLTSLPADWSQFAIELDRQPSDHVVTKKTWGAFTNTDLHDYLRLRNITQLILGGVATSIGVESTARAAHEHGYNVVLAVDAMTDTDANAHDHSVNRIFPRLGERGATDEILQLLSRERS